MKCCIKECKSQKYPGCETTFHGFPLDEQLRTKWVEATKVAGNVKSKRICALHFNNEDFSLRGRVIRLKKNVIPSFCQPPFKTYHNNKMILQSSIKCTRNNRDNKKCNQNGDTDVTYVTSNSSCDGLSLANTQIIKAMGISRCKCCLENDRLKSMWQEHVIAGQREVYGVMLTECFALHWRVPQNPSNSPDLICESCIMRLRDAVSFKTEVLASEQLLNSQLETVDVDKVKQEQDDLVNVQPEYVHYEDLDTAIDNEEDNSDDCADIDRNHDGDNNAGDEEVPIKCESHQSPNETLTSSHKQSSRRRQIEMTLRNKTRLLDSVPIKANVASKRYNVRSRANNTLKREDLISPMRKRLKQREKTDVNNLKKSIKGACTRNISEPIASMTERKVPELGEWNEDDKETQNNIKNGVVFVEIQRIDDEKEDSKKTIAEIKKELNRKTRSKLEENNKGDDFRMPNENRLAEMKKQASNIAIILECTNATPIRRHGGIGYGCCFCNEEFPDAADLKQHTIKEHDVKTKRNFAKGKRPSAYLVKLDITGLKCNLCGSTIDSLEQLYDHLIEIHKKLLYRNAKNYIIPFKFDQEELRCLFCEFICNSFKGLLEHMSVHYRNHICEICDAGFLTKNNLFNHTGRHKKGTFKCDFCPKIFDTSSKKSGHQRLVHSSTNGVNRCGYCGEMFGTYRRKEKHLITEHGITLKKLKCKACDKTFETQAGLRIHTKRDHLIERRFQCSVCDKRCFTNVQLNQHILKHTGVKKFQCTVCLKTYGRKSTLREHMRIHENDRRFKCELCGMAFVQKCSWRGHMLSKHGQQV